MARRNSQFERLDNTNGDSNIGCGSIDEFLKEDINSWYGGSVDEYFENHNLGLEVSDVKAEKAIFFEYGPGVVDAGAVWVFKMNGNVKTVNASGDLSDVGMYAPKGESKEVSLYYMLEIDDSDGGISMRDLKICR